MTRGLPNWFRALFTAVMLAVCCIVVSQLIYQSGALTQIDDLQAKLEASEQRLAKQQLQYDEAVAKLPNVQELLAQVAPEAEAAVARKDELKAQCSALTAENATLEATLDDLKAQAAAANTDYFADTDNINQCLTEVLESLDAALALLKD